MNIYSVEVKNTQDETSYDVFVNHELWGRVCFDTYFKVWRHSDDRYIATFQNRKGVVDGLIQSVLDNYKK